MYKLSRIFNGNRAEAKLVSEHAQMRDAINAGVTFFGRGGPGAGWGLMVTDPAGGEVLVDWADECERSPDAGLVESFRRRLRGQ